MFVRSSLGYIASVALAFAALNLPATRVARAADEQEDASDEGGDGEETPTTADPDQPSVTTGANYSTSNTPIDEVSRALILPQGNAEAWLSYVFHANEGAVFKLQDLELDIHYGILATLEAQVGFFVNTVVPDGTDRGWTLHLGIEQSIVYNLLDVRVGAEILKSGSADAQLAFAFGLPFKYRFGSTIAIMGLQDLFVIPVTGDKHDPLLNFSLTGVINVIEPLALLITAGFSFDSSNVDTSKALYLQVAGQFTINHNFDIGLALFLNNLTFSKPGMPDPMNPTAATSTFAGLDARGFLLYVRGRL